MCVTEQVQTFAGSLCKPSACREEINMLALFSSKQALHPFIIIRHCPSLLTDNDAVAARGNLVLGLLVIADVAGTVGAVLIAASGATAVDLDTLALAGDSVALAGARAAVGAGGAVAGDGGAGGGAVGAV